MRTAIAAGIVATLLGTAVIAGQSATPAPTGAIVGTGVFTVFVENMDRSLAFYHDAFGMDVPALPASGGRQYNPANPRLFAMFDIPGARERHQSARVAGTGVAVEVMDIQDVDHKNVDLRLQDPGTATLVLVVRDVNSMVDRVVHSGAAVVTTGGKPVALADGGRAVLVRDVDNRFIEIVQPASTASAAADASRDVLDMSVSIAVNDLNQAVHVYRDVLGFDVKVGDGFSADQASRMLSGLPKVESRRAQARANGSKLTLEFVEYRGVDRRPLKFKIQDRGAARLQLRAQNIDAVVDRVKSAGLKVVSDGAVAVPIPPNLKGALVADTDNFFLTLFEACDNCAPRR
jgi:catechol 2,3-dioxygenase-like lactoylglutathione lyase family enzyme